MISIKSKSYQQLQNELLGKKIHFKSNCELFPNFDVKGKVIGMKYGDHLEIIFEFLNTNGKKISIGSNMKNLRYEIL
jgi:hypothetical protein